MAFVNINGLNIYYEEHGKGETIMLLHHGFGCTKMWKDIWPALTAAGYRVVMYDRRGYGRSEPGFDFPEFYVSDRFRSESVQELDALRTMLSLDSFHLIGQCEGGVLAIDYTVSHPGPVRSMSVSSTQCYSTITMAELNALRMPSPFGYLKQEIREKLAAWHGPDRVEAFYEQFRTYGGAYGAGVFDLRGELPSVSCPALVLYPDRSFLFPVEQGLAMYRGLTRAELAVLPNCGHNTYEEQPEAYTRIILDFLRRQQS
jgi:pimeloyl-ACP methyl ester carboxylesterase